MTSFVLQFCYQDTKARPSDQIWLSQNPTKINFIGNQTFHTSFCIHLWQFPTTSAQKPWLHLFTHVATKAKKANPSNFAKPKPNQDEFLSQPNFWHLILNAFVTIPHQDCSKTMTSLTHQFCNQCKKKPIHLTWLSQNPTKIVLLQPNFWHLIFDAFLTIPTKIAKKPWLQLFINFATEAKNVNPPNLAKLKSNQDQFLLQSNFWHLMFYAFVTIPHQDCSKTDVIPLSI